MASVSSDIVVDAPIDEVWKVVADVGDLSWVAGVEDCRMDGDDRIVTMAGGMEIVERIGEIDHDGRTYTYSITAGLPVESHTGTVTVAEGDAGVIVTWATDVAPDEMAEPMNMGYAAGLENLKSRVEG